MLIQCIGKHLTYHSKYQIKRVTKMLKTINIILNVYVHIFDRSHISTSLLNRELAISISDKTKPTLT